MKNLILFTVLALVFVGAALAQDNNANASAAASPGSFIYYSGDCSNVGISPISESCASAAYCTSGTFAGYIIVETAAAESQCAPYFPWSNLVDATTYKPILGADQIDGEGFTRNTFFGNFTANSLGYVTCSDYWSTGASIGTCI